MRDYVDLIARCRTDDNNLSRECADAIQELQDLARRMTALGADLEEQIQDDLTPDLYSFTDRGSTVLYKREELSDFWTAIPDNVPFKMRAFKDLGDSWFVFFKEDGAEAPPREFTTEEEAVEALLPRPKEEAKEMTYT